MIKKRKSIFVFLIVLFFLLIPILSFCRSASGSHKSGTVNVRSYQRKNGVWVRAHTRGYPKSNSYPRYSSYLTPKSSNKSNYSSGYSNYPARYYSYRTRNSYKTSSYSKPYYGNKIRYFYKRKTYSSNRAKPFLNSHKTYLHNKKSYKFRHTKLQKNPFRNREPRNFSASMKRKKYNEQGGRCAICGNHCRYEDMEGDHKKPYSKGGRTIYSNLQMLCVKCNRRKSNK